MRGIGLFWLFLAVLGAPGWLAVSPPQNKAAITVLLHYTSTVRVIDGLRERTDLPCGTWKETDRDGNYFEVGFGVEIRG
jgi:hypothetical protein